MKKRSFAVLSLAMVLALAVSMLSGCSSKAGSTSTLLVIPCGYGVGELCDYFVTI